MKRLDDLEKWKLYTQVEKDRDIIPTKTAAEVLQRYRSMPELDLPNLTETSIRGAARKLGIRFAYSRSGKVNRVVLLERRVIELEQQQEATVKVVKHLCQKVGVPVNTTST